MRYTMHEKRINDMMSDLVKSAKETAGIIGDIDDNVVSELCVVKLLDVLSDVLSLTVSMSDITRDIYGLMAEVSSLEREAEELRHYKGTGSYQDYIAKLSLYLEGLEDELMKWADCIGEYCKEVDEIYRRVEKIHCLVGGYRCACSANEGGDGGENGSQYDMDWAAVLECCEKVLDTSQKISLLAGYCANVCEEMELKCSEIENSLM